MIISPGIYVIPRKRVNFIFEDQKFKGVKTDTIASALLRNGIFVFSYSRKTNRPQGYTCSTDFCSGSCLMTVDGVENVQTCKTMLKPGMKIERNKGAANGKI